MAFSSSGLQLISNPISPGNGPKVFTYFSADPHATVEAVGYFANGKRLGMLVGDIVFVACNSSQVTPHLVIASTGAIAASATLGSSAYDQNFNCTVSAATT